MPLVKRFEGVHSGAMTMTGNSVVISRNTAYPPGQPFNTGAFITTDTLLQVSGYLPGTTRNGSLASSSAQLDIPSGSTVLYAELMWCRRNAVNPNSSIRFITPVTSVNITPTLSDDTVSSIAWRAAVVTDYINNGGSGFYTCGNFPTTVAPSGANTITTNWTLLVVYKNINLPVRYFNINTGALFVSTALPANFVFSGFATPTSGPVKGYFFYTASNGDLNDSAQLRVGPTSPPTNLLGNTSNPYNGLSPYNPTNNMTPASVCYADGNSPNIGLLDTRGSFGAYNVDPYNNIMPAFGRQVYDLAGIDMSHTLNNNQTTLSTSISFINGTASVHTEAVQIDANAPIINPVKTVNKSFATVGDTLNYTVSFTNTGLVNADEMVFFDTIPSSTSLVGGSVYIDNINYPLANPQPPGISLNTVSISQTMTISFDVIITSLPNPSTIVNNSQITYTYIPIVSLPKLYGSAISNNVTTTVSHADLKGITKFVDKTFTTCGETLTYTVVIPNAGNTTALNILFKDTIPNGLTFVPNSLIVNGFIQFGANPANGIILSSIPAGSTTTISFLVNVIC